jgi:hypothetical protein
MSHPVAGLFVFVNLFVFILGGFVYLFLGGGSGTKRQVGARSGQVMNSLSRNFGFVVLQMQKGPRKGLKVCSVLGKHP